MLNSQVKIGSVRLKVSDLDTQKNFYRDLIGLEVLESTQSNVLLGAGDQVLVELVSLPEGRTPHGTTGLYHMALRVPSQVDLGRWLQHYIKHDAPFWQGASDHGFSEALYLSDPEGNGIEIYADKPKSEWIYREDGQIAAIIDPLNLQSLLPDNPHPNWEGLPSGTDMGHMHLKVSDIEDARIFYTEMLGFDIKTKYQDSALFIAAGDYHHHIGLNTWQSKGAPPAPQDSLGLAEFTIQNIDKVTLHRIQENLLANDYPHEIKEDGLFVADPSGNPLCLSI